jgi:hypothetical protein
MGSLSDEYPVCPYVRDSTFERADNDSQKVTKRSLRVASKFLIGPLATNSRRCSRVELRITISKFQTVIVGNFNGSFSRPDDHWASCNFKFPMIATFKRVVTCQHHVYKHADIDNILDDLMINRPERRAIVKISRDICIPDTTLRHYHRQRVFNPTWFPFATGHPRTRALDPDAEAAVAEFALVNYIDPGIGATRQDLKELCLTSYAQQTDDKRHFERFCASSTFV